MPTHNLHSRMNNFFQEREADRQVNREVCVPNSRPNTLQSVLRGDIPSEYLHLTSFANESRPINGVSHRHTLSDNNHNDQLIDQIRTHHHHNHQQQQSRSGSDNVQYTIPVHRQIMEGDYPEVSSRPGTPQHRMSPYGRPSPSTPFGGYRSHHEDTGHTIDQYYERRSPSYHTSRSSPYHDPGSPYSRQGGSPHLHSHQASPVRSYSPRTSRSPLLAPNSPISAHQSPYHSSTEDVFTGNEQPIDLSCKPSDKSASTPELFTSTIEDTSEGQPSGSMLRELLRSGKQDSHRTSDRDSPCSDVTKPEVPVTSSTPVTLAKKMIHPITSRVSDWLVKIVQFSKSIPEFSNMSSNDKLTLLANSWARILILFMAENEFEFAVTPLQSAEGQGVNAGQNKDECPTMKSVETIQGFIKKCKNMNLDQKEYALLRMSVLFNNGHVGLDNPDIIEKLNAAVQQLLQQHVTKKRPDDAMHYSRILMCLPTLYGINCKMIENLFCQGIHPNIDIDMLLLEMLRNL